jgi:cysteine desulfurase/selenocysteine lyase
MEATVLDPVRIRADFPILHQDVHGHPLVYLDNAASTQRPTAVLDAMRYYYEHDHANVHRGIHELSRRATDAYEDARAKVARWINAPDAAELIWTRGTTEGINLVADGWGYSNLNEGDEIILSILEHHSNLIPWQMVAKRRGAKLRFVDVDEEGRLRMDEFEALLGEKTKVVSLGHVSNSIGTINPIQEIAAKARAAGALMVVDGAQGAPHLPVDVQALGCDFYAFSAHKMCGPTGIGALWGRRELLEAMDPYQGGGEMISVVELETSTWAELPHKFEAGTPNIAGAIGFGAAVDYLEEIGRDAIRAHEVDLVGYALEKMAEIPWIRVFGPSSPEERSGVVAFEVEGAHPHDVATILDAHGVAIRAGHHCTQPLMRRLGVPATNRASFYIYNTRAEVDVMVRALHAVHDIFGD